jgi:hypothetical protein
MTQNPDVKHLSTPPVNAGDIIAEQQADTANEVALAVTGLTFWRDAILSQIPFIGDRFRSPADLQAHVNALQARYARGIEEGLKGHAANDNDEYEAEQKKAA